MSDKTKNALALEACPFCGEKNLSVTDMPYRKWSVNCLNIKCKASIIAHDDFHSQRSFVIQAWNTRALSTPAPDDALAKMQSWADEIKRKHGDDWQAVNHAYYLARILNVIDNDNGQFAPDDVDVENINIEMLENLYNSATDDYWFIVEQPWNNGNPYINAGSNDPHMGKAIIDVIERDSYEGEDDADIENQRINDELENRANCEFICFVKNNTPEILRALKSLSRPHDVPEVNESVLISELTKNVCPRAYATGVVKYLKKKGYLSQSPIPEGYALVPIEPTEEQWDGLARALVMARDLKCYKADEVRKHLNNCGHEIPDWLDEELVGGKHMAKGDMAVIIYKAMIAQSPKAETQDKWLYIQLPKQGEIYAYGDFGEGFEVRILSKETEDDEWFCDSGECVFEPSQIMCWQHHNKPPPPAQHLTEDD